MFIKLNCSENLSEEFSDILIDYNNRIINKLIEILDPLSIFNISLFEYHVFFNDYRLFYLSTNSKWHKHYINKYANSNLTINHIKNVFEERIKYNFIDSSMIKTEEFYDLKKDMREHNIENYFTIYIHHKYHIESFSFATKINNQSSINTNLNNIDKFYRYIVFFYDKSRDIIDNKILNSNGDLIKENGLFVNCKECLSNQEMKVLDFLKDTEIIRFPIMTENGIKYLSPRQAQCVYYLARGRKQKEIGKLLEIGHKAVETHLEKARLKIGCQNNSCLIKIFEGSVLDQMVFFKEQLK